MTKNSIDFDFPPPDIHSEHVSKSEELLKELHESILSTGITKSDWLEAVQVGKNPLSSGAALREPIFYGGDSAYSFQYRDLAIKRYTKDEAWLMSNLGISTDSGSRVAAAISSHQSKMAIQHIQSLKDKPISDWTLLPCFEFSVDELTAICDVEASGIQRILERFCLSQGELNIGFNNLNDFNLSNAKPLIKTSTGTFILLQHYNLVETLYESPFHWMRDNSDYLPTAAKNRGSFTEEFVAERLQRVFGSGHVFSNVKIVKANADVLGEIDVFVVFANRLIIVQTKSKSLTLAARKGNDQQIRDDFKKGVQDAYDQAYSCAKIVLERQEKFLDVHNNEIKLLAKTKEIYLLCIVADHYPALSFQAKQFLKYHVSETMLAPLVLDVFALDAMTEMLDSPLRFLSYLNRRVVYDDRVMASNELTILAYHLRKNLWLDESYQVVFLHDDFSASLDIAMATRRDGIPGKATPDGILTRFNATSIGNLVNDIESADHSGLLDLGFVLLTMDEETIREINRTIDLLARRYRQDAKSHDVSIGLPGKVGLTIHCNSEGAFIASENLQRHCVLRKYKSKADAWFGVCVNPNDLRMRFGIGVSYPWIEDAELERQATGLPDADKEHRKRDFFHKQKKIGRNDPCSCGSGLKYKRCCLNKIN